MKKQRLLQMLVLIRASTASTSLWSERFTISYLIFEVTSSANEHVLFDYTYADVARAAFEECLFCQWISYDRRFAPSPRQSWAESFEQLRKSRKDMALDMQLCSCVQLSYPKIDSLDLISFGLWNNESQHEEQAFGKRPPIRAYTKPGKSFPNYSLIVGAFFPLWC
jgi:hypothetical protein